MNKKKPTEFQTLQTEWYQKLKDEGFKDIEHKDGSINRCSPRSETFMDDRLRQLTLDYYCVCTHFLNEHNFTDETEKVIWEYHTEGLSIRDIVEILNKTLTTKRTRVQIWKTVSSLKKIMKGKYLSA